MKWIPLLLLAAATSACRVHVPVERLCELKLHIDAQVPPERRIASHFVVTQFADERGGELGSYTDFLPSLFHFTDRLEYVEAGLFDGMTGRAALGTLDAAMPALLAETMRRMGLGAAAPDARARPSGAREYLVTGRIKRASVQTSGSVLVGVAVGFFGAPFAVVRYQLEYDVLLYRAADPTTPIFQRTYRYRDRRYLGVYYNHDARYRMLVESLEDTLPRVVEDLSLAAGGNS
jgi:hypothetical protein